MGSLMSFAEKTISRIPQSKFVCGKPWKSLCPSLPISLFLVDKDGQALSKRLDSLSVRFLRETLHLEPAAILASLATIGTSEAPSPEKTLEDLIRGFDFAKISAQSPRFDLQALQKFNKRLLQTQSVEQVRNAVDNDRLSPEIWETIRFNVETRQEVKEWIERLTLPLEPTIVDPPLTALAADLLPSEPWQETTCDDWLNAINVRSAQSGKALYRPIRLALTAQPHGPELKKILPLLGYQKAYSRLKGQTA